MPSQPHIPYRRSTRLKHYDYSQPGSYFVTICVKDMHCLFGQVRQEAMHLSQAGHHAQSIWLTLPDRFPGVRLDHYVVMPNHLHGIILIEETQAIAFEDAKRSAMPERFRRTDPSNIAAQPEPYTAPLGEIVRTFKGAATYRIRTTGLPEFAWQHRYYDHVIRNEADLQRIRSYIVNNPARWEQDKLYRA
jgi:putative transposase